MQKYKKASATWLQKPFLCKILKFRKFYPTRPERAEALSPGQRPGLLRSQTWRPVRAKALKLVAIYKAFALTGRQVTAPNNPGRCPGLRASAPSGRMGKNLRNFNYHIRCRIDSFPSLKRRSRILMLGRKPSLCS